MRKNVFKCFLFLLPLGTLYNLNAQTTISGPSCVIPGMPIQYLINGKWTNTSTMEICVKNGKLESTGNTCYNGKPVSYIRVIWDNSGTTGSINLTSSDGNASQSVRITRQLKAGIIDTKSEKQEIEYNSAPGTISCSPALWGSCDPVFLYKWQQSSDGMKWTDIASETGNSLTVSRSLTQTVFFRRKVTETKSTTVGFSNVAVVVVRVRKN